MPEQEEQEEDWVIPRNKAQDNSGLEYQLSTKDIIDELIHIIKGEYFDDQTQTYKKQANYIDRINNVGLADIRFTTSLQTNKNTFLSYLDKGHINTAMGVLHRIIATQIFLNREKYELDKAQMSNVLFGVLNFMYAGFKRAEDGKTIIAMTKQHSIMERIDKKPEKKGFGLPFFGRGDS